MLKLTLKSCASSWGSRTCRLITSLTLVALTLVASMAGGPSAQAATRTVTSLADDGTAGTLRSQIAAATSGDTINFNVTGSISLLAGAGGALPINKDLTITGPGANNLTVAPTSGASIGIFVISSGVANISGLKLSGGTANNGGAIYMSGGTTTVSNCIFSGNRSFRGGAIYMLDGTMKIVGCTLSGNGSDSSCYEGGAVSAYGGSMTITSSTLAGNQSSRGGGLYFGGATLSVENSTISGNFAYTTYVDDSTPRRDGLGGGIFQANGTVTVTNSTISGNNAYGTNYILPGGGGIFTYGGLSVANSTITGNFGTNGGGIDCLGSSLNLSNSIVAGNTGSNADIFGTAVGDYNLVQNGQSFSGGPHNILGQAPLLGPLANNGGPTQTHALLKGSPAVDTGDPNFDTTNLPYDQRGVGYPRVRNGRLCIGAYESEASQSGSNLIVNTLDDHDDGICGLTDCSLRDAISAAPAGGAITFAMTGTLTLTRGELVISKQVSITGPSSSPGITILGNGASRVIYLGYTVDANGNTSAGPPSQVNLTNLTLSGGNGTGRVGTGLGGAVYIDGNATNLTVANCTFSGNSAPSVPGVASSGNGGAIRSPGTLTVTNSTFFGNSAGANGGGIRSGGTLTVANCTFSGNSAGTGRGGGIDINQGTFSLSNSIVAGNSATTSPDVGGVVNSGDYNLVQNGTTLPGTHNITGQSAQLGALANNGGPTQTMALLAGSPALDVGDPAFNSNGQFDQRGAGYPRVQNGRLDIGAFETQLSPTLSVSNVSQLEGSGGTPQQMRFTVSVSAVSSSAVTVNYATAAGTATSDSDFTGTSGTLTIPAGQSSGTLSVPIIGDTTKEPDETFGLTLSSPVNAGFASGATSLSATGTILNDDATPTVSINGVNQAEGNDGNTPFNFVVRLSVPSSVAVSFNYATSDGTATAGSDYTATSGTLTIPAGSTTGTISVPVVGDATVEGDETFTLTLSNPANGVFPNGASTLATTGTIVNDDNNTTPAATDVTSQFTIYRSSLTRNRSTGRWVLAMVIQNSGATIDGPLYLAFDNLSGGVSLYNPDGSTSRTSPAGSSYRTLTLPGVSVTKPSGIFASGSALNLNVEFVNPGNATINFTPRLLQGPGTP